jgi:hypothetical protein
MSARVTNDDRATCREGQDMDENVGRARGDTTAAWSVGRRSKKPTWVLLFLLVFAGNVVVAALTWFLVGLFLK